MSRQYELRSIADMGSIPFDRLDAFFKDLRYALDLAHFAAGEDMPVSDLLAAVTWTDDNDHSVHLDGTDGPILTLEITE